MRLIKALGALIVLVAVLVGPPWALLRFIGNPWPAEGVSLSAPLTDNAILGLLLVVVWVLWAQLVVCILAELAAAVTDDRVHVRVLFALPVQQHLARRLVAALAVVAVTSPIAAGAAHAAHIPAPTPVGNPTSTSAATGTASLETPMPASQVGYRPARAHGHAPAQSTGAPQARYETVTVMRLDSLWSIADRVLGDGDQWQRIAALNEGRVMSDGTRFTSADHIRPGWELRVPGRPGTSAPSATPAQPSAHTVTVHQGDTLSQIAQDQLGDATDYPAIFRASRHLTQPDGQHLTDPDLIDVGWTLQIPAQPPAQTAVQVRPGTTDHATPQHGGDDGAGHHGHHDHQPVPHHGQDPSGQPTQDPTQEPIQEPTQVPSPSPSPSSQVPNQVDEAPGSGRVVASPADTDTGSDSDFDVVSASWVLGGLTGGGALLAGALLLGLQRRRRAQFRARRPGRAIVAPPPEAAPAEMTAIAAGGPAMPTVDFVHGALRRLAENARAHATAMPPVAAVEVTTDTLTLHLSGPADLDLPWQATPDRLHWQCPTSTPLDAIGPDASWVEPPYPMLVTIGHDQDDTAVANADPSADPAAGMTVGRGVAAALTGGVWLLNLEELGATRVLGDSARVGDFVRHLTAQLAVNPWSEMVGLDCVGIAEETQPLGEKVVGEKVSYHPAGSAAGGAAVAAATQLAEATIDRAVARDVDLSTGRARDADGDVWPSRAVVVLAATTTTNTTTDTTTDATNGNNVDADDTWAGLGRLVELITGHTGRTGTAVVIVGDGAPRVTATATLRLTAQGRVVLDRQELDLVAVGLTSAEARGCAQLYAHADILQDVEIPVDHDADTGWEAYADRAGAIRREHTLPRSTPENALTEPVTSVLRGADEDYVEMAPATIEDLEAVAPVVPERVRDDVKRADPDLDADLADLLDPDSPRPKVTLLGPVDVTAHGRALAKNKATCVELVAYLALRPRHNVTVTRDELAEALGLADPGRVRKYVDLARHWLGEDPVTGQSYLPPSLRRPETGAWVYRASAGVLTDLDLFKRLRTRGSQADLVRALDLVTGRPFAQLPDDRWSWLRLGERHDLYMTAAIADVAFTVVTHCLKEGDLPRARAAAEIAMVAVPEEQVVQLCQVAVTRAEGDETEAMRFLIEEICDWAESGDLPDDLPERTMEIIRKQGWLAS